MQNRNVRFIIMYIIIVEDYYNVNLHDLNHVKLNKMISYILLRYELFI